MKRQGDWLGEVLRFASMALAVAGCGTASDAPSGPAACAAAEGACIPGAPGGCADGTIGPQDCNPDRNPSGAVCCLPGSGEPADATTDADTPTNAANAPDACLADAQENRIGTSSYDTSCSADTDCVAVGFGNACDLCEILCPNAAISKAAEPGYRDDVAMSAAGVPFVACFCPATPQFACCKGGSCSLDCPILVAADAGDADAR
jgi:hypothetical protein